MTEDTIAAISTAVGEGAIAIVRLSGPRAFEISDAIFISSSGRPSEFLTHTIHFGKIGRNGDLIDQVMLSVMRAPRTYTAENVVEINCHGGSLTSRKILAACLNNGARLAEPGEFTKRAFLNGRIDLTQAEAVMDLISAKTDLAHSAAAHTLEGHLAKRVEQMRQQLITTLAHLEAQIDFPEEDISPDTRAKLVRDVDDVIQELRRLLATSREGKILREGVAVAIIGRPNVGKSSLMNVLLGQERSIVAPTPGTTRDTIEETANIRGIPVRFTDTAGIRNARGAVEGIGVARSRNALSASALVLLVLDASRPSSRADRDLAKLSLGKPVVQVLNKIDLPRKLKQPPDFEAVSSAEVSAATGDGIEYLKDLIVDQVWSGRATTNEFNVAINERHSSALSSAINALVSGGEQLKSAAPNEFVSQELRIALDAIGEIVGKTSTEFILDKIFSTFCIGK
jgi:tRNA modification GTPase